jgi:AcrR family transcriptional regulator
MAEGKHGSRGDDRRRAILEAAAEIFFERGYAATSIDAIIERAGGSKRNIYAQFRNKAGLFTAIVSQNADRALAALAIEDAAGQALRDTLTAFGRQLMDVYMSPTVLGVFRLAIAEAHRDPDLARAFYDIGPGRTAAGLSAVLERAAARGEIESDDPALHAEHFVGMIRDNLHLQVVLGLRPPPSAEEVRRVVESAVAVFLDGLRPRRAD